MQHLLELYKSRLAALLPRRDALLKRQAECAADASEQGELLADLERTQKEYSYTAMGFANALYSCILEPEQVGAGGGGRGTAFYGTAGRQVPCGGLASRGQREQGLRLAWRQRLCARAPLGPK